MRFRFTEEQEKLRKEMDEFFEKEVTPELREEARRSMLAEGGEVPPSVHEFNEKVVAKGWMGLQTNLSFTEGSIFEEEVGYWQAPISYHTERIVMGVLQRYGSEEQKRAFLPKIQSGEMRLCLCYTEPSHGSDLAALETSAVEDGDEYVINGEKMYISAGMAATHGWLAARTNPDVPKHRGISMFIVDLNAPGVTRRPMPTLGAFGTPAEIFFDNVRVPRLNQIGERDRGWYLLAGALDVQRARIGEVGGLRRTMPELVQFLKETKIEGEPLSEDPIVRDKFAQVAIEAEVARLFNYRSVWAGTKGVVPPYYTSMSTMYIRESQQRRAQTMMEIIGLYGQFKEGSKWALLKGLLERNYRAVPALTIAGGTSEIQRNVIAQRGIGLPR